MGRTSRLWSFIIVALILFTTGIPGVATGALNIGQKLPAISGRNLVGETVSVDEYYNDSTVVLAFWSMYCKPCVAEISSLIKLQDTYGDKLVVIGINTDGELPPSRVRTFIERYEQFEKKKLNYQIIFDEHNRITKMLGVGFLPTVLALDNTGKIINSFVGFEEQDEAEIFQGIENLLPMAREIPSDTGTVILDVESRVPACGFYDETGWRESFYGNVDLSKEMDKVARISREMAMKEAMREALARLGVRLYEKEAGMECFKPYGVLLRENPWKQRDCMTNMLNSISFRNYSQVIETNERWLGKEYYVRQKISVNLTQLKEEMEARDFSFKPTTISFVVINMGMIDRMDFQEAILSQSKYIGSTNFPAYTIYCSQENFISELDRMDFGNYRVFISDAGSGVIEVEIWR